MLVAESVVGLTASINSSSETELLNAASGTFTNARGPWGVFTAKFPVELVTVVWGTRKGKPMDPPVVVRNGITPVVVVITEEKEEVNEEELDE